MASANKMFRLKYSCEEVYERMDKGLCIFCEELDTPGHHQLKHKGVRIVMTECDDDQVFEDKEEAHQETVTNPNPSVETVTNPEPLVETLKNSGPFIESLKRASVLQVPDSFCDVLLVHKMDSHVKDVKEFTQQSTNDNGKNIALQVFDEMPLRVTSKEKQRKSLKAWRFKFKTSFKRSKLMDNMLSVVEETVLLDKDHKETIWDCVKKEFKEIMAACGEKRIDRFKIVEETLKPAVHDGTVQIRVWDCGGSPLECVDESYCDGKSSEEAVTVLEACPQLFNTFLRICEYNKVDKPWVCNDRQKGAVCDAENKKLLNIEAGAKKGTNSCLGGKIAVAWSREKGMVSKVSGSTFDLECDQIKFNNKEEFVGLTESGELRPSREYLLMNFGIFMNPQPLHDKRITRALLVGLVGTEEKLSNRLSLANYVWKPGELLCVQDQWDWISEVHNGGGILKITQQLRGMRLQGFINMDKKLQKLLLDDVLRVMVCWSVHNRTFEAEWKIYLSANQTSRNQELLIIYCFLMIGEFSRSKRLNETCCFLLEVYFDKFVGCKTHGNETQSTNQSHGMEGSKRDIQGLESGHKRKVLKLKLPLSYGADWEQPIKWADVHFSDNQRQEKGLLSFPWELMLANLKENHACGDVKFHLKHKWRSRLLQTFLRLEVFVENVVLFTGPDKLLFSNNHKLLHPEIGFCIQYNDLELLNTEHQSSPGLDYFTYLILKWNQALDCGCEAGYISSGFFSVGDVHEFFTCSKLKNGDETYGKKLLDMNEVSLLDNDNKVDFTIKASWCYHKPMIREVFHLQRPPELIDIQGNPNFITKVLVQWKEHPPDQFFSSFYWQVLMLSSLRTRMFRRGKYCDRIISNPGSHKPDFS